MAIHHLSALGGYVSFICHYKVILYHYLDNSTQYSHSISVRPIPIAFACLIPTKVSLLMPLYMLMNETQLYF